MEAAGIALWSNSSLSILLPVESKKVPRRGPDVCASACRIFSPLPVLPIGSSLLPTPGAKTSPSTPSPSSDFPVVALLGFQVVAPSHQELPASWHIRCSQCWRGRPVLRHAAPLAPSAVLKDGPSLLVRLGLPPPVPVPRLHTRNLPHSWRTAARGDRPPPGRDLRVDLLRGLGPSTGQAPPRRAPAHLLHEA